MYLSWIVILDECGALLLGEGHGWQGTQAERPAAAASALLHLRSVVHRSRIHHLTHDYALSSLLNSESHPYNAHTHTGGARS